MSNPIFELKALLLGGGEAPSSGRVVSVGSGVVTVKTGKGVVVATNLPSVQTRVGSKVVMQGKIITGVSADTGNLPVHRV